MDLFEAQGYEATSVKDILTRAGANSGSLYHFFPGKEDILVAVLDRYVDLLWPAVIEPAFARTADPVERVFAVLEGYRAMLIATGCRAGCPIGILALEMSEKSEPVRERCALNFENWRLAIRKALEDAGDRLPADVDRDRLATFVLTTMEGGVMLARTQRSLTPFEAAVSALRDYFERLKAQAGRTEPVGGADDSADRTAGRGAWPPGWAWQEPKG